jgi:hypothetical protein
MRRLLRNPRFVVPLAAIAVGFAALRSVEQLRTPPPASGAWTHDEGETSEDAPTGALATVVPASTGSLEHWMPSSALRDPFAVPAPAPEISPTMTPDQPSAPPPAPRAVLVAATWQQGEQHFALVDGRICRPGDQVGHVTVESIERAAVWLVHPGGRSRVPVGHEILVTPPAGTASAAPGETPPPSPLVS